MRWSACTPSLRSTPARKVSALRRIRVVHCLESLSSGGVEQCRLSLARGLDPQRYEQIIICTDANEAMSERFAAAGCAVRPIGVFRGIADWTRYANALKIIRAFKPDIVHGAVFEGLATAVVAGRLARAPIIIGEETSDPINRKPRGHVLFRGLTLGTHRMVAVSPAVEKYLVEGIRIPQRKVVRIDNGVAEPPPVDSAELQMLRAELGFAPEDFVVGTVGRLLDECKKVSDLIAAVALLRQKNPRARLLIVGDGPDRAALEAKAAVHPGLAVFTGYRPNPRPYLELMDVFALASAHEAFGLVLVEAMLANLPIVATDVGGIPYVLGGEAGLTVRPSRPDQLAGALSELLADPPRRARMGALGRQRAKQMFGAERYVCEVDALYTSLLAGEAR